MRNNLKNILSLFVMFFIFLFGMTGVKAANTCSDNETEYTNYYLFLLANYAEYNNTNIENNSGNFVVRNGALKYNNIQGSTITEKGTIAVTYNGQTTSSSASKTMTAKEFWSKYYVAKKNAASDTLAYAKGTNTYIVHSDWIDYYDDSYTSAYNRKPTEKNNATTNALISYLGNNASSNYNELISNGTSLPETTIIEPTDLATSTNVQFKFKISRTMKNSDVKTGMDLENDGKKWVLSPAVYYVKYCVKTSEDVKTKTITYKENTTDTVTNMPKNTVTKLEETDTISNNVPVRDGYTFLGWDKNKDATTPTYTAGKSYDYKEQKDLTLYAIWKKNDTTPDVEVYHIYYNANTTDTVTNLPGTQTANIGTSMTISSLIPVRNGYTFLGWSTDSKATSGDKNYTGGTTYSDGKDLTLYAIWQKNDTPVNPQTGITDFLIPASVVSTVSGGSLMLLKKKRFIRQF